MTNNSDKKALTINGTKYEASAKISGENLSDVSVKQDYTIYLDSYGYMIYVEENEAIGDYALILNIKQGSNDWYLATALSCCSPTAPPRSSPPTRITSPRRAWRRMILSPTR